MFYAKISSALVTLRINYEINLKLNVKHPVAKESGAAESALRL